MMKFAYLICFLLVALLLNGQDLQNKIEQLLEHEDFKYSSVGLSVRDMDDQLLIDYEGDRLLCPASSMKLITTLIAIDDLGEDYVFRTRLGYSGTIDRSGHLDGDLIIIASGDPSFASQRFGPKYELKEIMSKMVDAVIDHGINCIDGHLTIHTNVFDGQNVNGSWPYSDIANYYGSGAWALNWNENEYDLTFQKGSKIGNLAQIEGFDPKVPGLKVKSMVRFAGPKTGDQAYIYGDPYHYNKIVRGTIPLSSGTFKIRGAIPDPTRSFGFYLLNELFLNGIQISGVEIKEEPIRSSDFEELTSFKSPELKELVRATNQESINLYCEALLRLMGKKHHQRGSIEHGLEWIEEYLDDVPVNLKCVDLYDGSGLSPQNSITSKSFTSLINHFLNRFSVNQLKVYIPRAGYEGTVKSLFSGQKPKGSFYLKSGSMNGVLTYTGFFYGSSGNLYSICFMVNRHQTRSSAIRRHFEKICSELYDEL